jgi:hypothetical protein
MLVPSFIAEKFPVGTLVSVWFRRGSIAGGVYGRVQSWEEHSDELSTYLLFETIDGDTLHVPFSDIYLSTLTEKDFEEAKVNAKKREALAVRKRHVEEFQLSQLEEAMSRSGRIAQPM